MDRALEPGPCPSRSIRVRHILLFRAYPPAGKSAAIFRHRHRGPGISFHLAFLRTHISALLRPNGPPHIPDGHRSAPARQQHVSNPLAGGTGLLGVRTHRDLLAMAPPFGLCRSEEHTSELQSLMRISYAV